MRRWVLVGGVAVAAALLGAPPAEPTVYGVNWQGSLGLVRLDAKTLGPRGGRRVPLAGEPLGWSFAPDRSRIAMGSTARGARISLIDLRRMRALGVVEVARRGSGVATAWAGPRRVLAVVVTPGCCGAGDTTIAGIDAVRRRVIWRRALGGSLQAGERYRRGLLLVLGPRGRSVGPSRLVRVGPRGGVRSVDLPEIRSGSEPAGSVTQSWTPGLAVDRSRDRAFAVQARAPLAEVDLRSWRVRSHSLGPEAQAADAVAGPSRHALWLGRGLLAITGLDRHSSAERPAGLTLVDTRSWTARTIDARVSDVRLVSGTLMATSFLFDSRRQRYSGSGLSGYSIDGRSRFHRYGKLPLTGVQAIGRRALVGTPSGAALVDARTGRPLRRFRRFAISLLVGDAPILY